MTMPPAHVVILDLIRGPAWVGQEAEPRLKAGVTYDLKNKGG